MADLTGGIEYTWKHVIDEGSILYKLAVDSGMQLVESRLGMATFIADLDSHIEYINYRKANALAIKREFMLRYKL